MRTIVTNSIPERKEETERIEKMKQERAERERVRQIEQRTSQEASQSR